MLVLCDFDGTITTTDITNLLWDEFGLPGWRETLLPPYRAGTVSALELMDAGWRAIAVPEAELLAFARPRVALRDGFAALHTLCASRGWPLHVVSGGLGWYLRAFLPEDVEFTSYEAALEDGWRVRLRQGYVLPEGVDFKVHVMRGLQARHPHLPTLLIGDGRNDFPIAQASDRVFAIRNSTLAHLCAKHAVPCVEFDSFDEVIAALS